MGMHGTGCAITHMPSSVLGTPPVSPMEAGVMIACAAGTISQADTAQATAPPSAASYCGFGYGIYGLQTDGAQPGTIRAQGPIPGGEDGSFVARNCPSPDQYSS